MDATVIGRLMGRVLAGAGIGVCLVLVTAHPVAADPPGPTDYRSEVVEISPPTPTLRAEIIGGDSFIELTVDPGVEVVVLGYEAEPYLRFRSEGGIEQNQRSPAVSLNRERYGAEIDPRADADAEPSWKRIGDGHTWAWHDHRVHRMEPFAPLGAARGQQILDGSVPIVVDGEPVRIRVTSTWMPAPSPVAMVIGLISGAAIVAVAWLRARSWQGSAAALAGVSAAAMVAGSVQYASLPASTNPLWVWWFMPTLATLAAVAALAVDRWLPAHRFWAPGLMGIAAAQLLVWGLERRTGLVRAILPTPLAHPLDRVITATAISAAITTLVVTGAVYSRLLSASTARTATPHPDHR